MVAGNIHNKVKESNSDSQNEERSGFLMWKSPKKIEAPKSERLRLLYLLKLGPLGSALIPEVSILD
jgi:hypothetical protein